MNKSDSSISRRNLLASAAGAVTLATLSDGGFSSAQAAAPMQGASVPTLYRFKLGAFEVTTINDGAVQLDGPHPIFGQNVEAKEVQDLAVKNFLPPTRMEIGFTPVIVNTGTEVVLFDTGNGDRNRPKTGLLGAALAQAGLSVEQIDKVVITHAHPDHISGLIEDGKPIFPNAQYFMSEMEYDFWSPKDKLTGKTERVAKLVQSKVVPLVEKFTFVLPQESVPSAPSATRRAIRFSTLKAKASASCYWRIQSITLLPPCNAPIGMCVLTWTKLKPAPRAGACLTCWPKTALPLPDTTCRSRPWASLKNQKVPATVMFPFPTSLMSETKK